MYVQSFASLSIPKKPYWKGTLRKLNGTEKRFSRFCLDMLVMTGVKYATDAVIPYFQLQYD